MPNEELIETKAQELHRHAGLATRWDCCPESYRERYRKNARLALHLDEDGYPYPIDQWGEHD